MSWTPKTGQGNKVGDGPAVSQQGGMALCPVWDGNSTKLHSKRRSPSRPSKARKRSPSWPASTASPQPNRPMEDGAYREAARLVLRSKETAGEELGGDRSRAVPADRPAQGAA